MRYKNASLKKYLDDLAARLPAPGGGSAAALAGALGVSLISMVVNFTLGKPRYAVYEKALRKTLSLSETLRLNFLKLVDLDVIAYRSKNINKALDVPLKVCQLSLEGIRLCPGLVKKGNRNLISDVAVAAVMLESAFSSAYYNVEINLACLNDKKLSSELRKELAQKANSVKRVRIKTEDKVGDIIRR